MVAAHPYRRQMPWYMEDERDYEEALVRASRNPAYKYCAALEKLNGRGTVKENEFSAALCDYMEMPGTAGTDSHSRSDIGRVRDGLRARHPRRRRAHRGAEGRPLRCRRPHRQAAPPRPHRDPRDTTRLYARRVTVKQRRPAQ